MEGRRRVTLYDQMKAGDDNTSSSSRNSLASFLDDDVVLTSQNQKTPNQTLLDIIREEEQEPNNNNNNNNTTKDRKSWKAFKDVMMMIRLKRSRNSDESTHRQHTDNSDPTTMVLTGGEGESSDEEPETRQVSMSLMDLLEETEVELDPRSDIGDDCDGDGMVDEYEKQEEEQEEVERVVDTVEYNCCVCMVRHKGAAFIPCGHTFCRMCSRELWVSRGNCPICNNSIVEILDIF